MTRDAPDLRYWIRHHLRYFDLVFLRVEGGQPVESDNRVVVVETAEPEDDGLLLRQQHRQVDFVDACVRRTARAYGVRYLLHIDDDELFVADPRWPDAASLLRSIAWGGATHARIQNHEAVFRGDPGDGAEPYFSDPRLVFRDGARSAFMRGYRNGKSVCDTLSGPKCTGCHTFEGSAMLLRSAAILHFDCLSFERWKTKFSRIRDTTGLPPFYGRSVRAIRTGDEHEQRRVWRDGVVMIPGEPLAGIRNNVPGS
jgi:hypothetical protein